AARVVWSINSPPFNPPATKTYGVFITDTKLDMKVDTVITNADASLVTLAGSIVDARLGGAGKQTGPANVIANNIDLDAHGGSIGAPQSANPDARGQPAGRGPQPDQPRHRLGLPARKRDPRGRGCQARHPAREHQRAGRLDPAACRRQREYGSAGSLLRDRGEHVHHRGPVDRHLR